jgi:hypothetical protein
MTRLRFASFLAPNMFPVYRFIVERLGRRLGIAAELNVGEDFGEFTAGRADAGFL